MQFENIRTTIFIGPSNKINSAMERAAFGDAMTDHFAKQGVQLVTRIADVPPRTAEQIERTTGLVFYPDRKKLWMLGERESDFWLKSHIYGKRSERSLDAVINFQSKMIRLVNDGYANAAIIGFDTEDKFQARPFAKRLISKPIDELINWLNEIKQENNKW